MAEVVRGTMLWFNQAKDLGELASEAEERLPVEGRDFAAGERPVQRCAGAAVTFRVTEDDEGAKATDVSFVPEVAPRRARMRHARYRSG
ncbi:MAG: hypothetical protein M3321_05145 [Actinomycetota bacterium]|nr:hypothetical protein [Actinomycetota bacterium]